MSTFLKYGGKEKTSFLQSKYEYYRKFNKWVIIFSCITSLFYFISDCLILGDFSNKTLLPRAIIFLPLLLFLILEKTVINYKIMVPFSYFMIHFFVWCCIFAIANLPLRNHANESFIVLQLLFFAVGYSASFGFSTFSHSLLIVDILVSNTFLHYDNLSSILSFAVPCIFGICVMNFVMSGIYVDHYDTKNELEKMIIIDQLTQVYNRMKIESIVDKDTHRFVSSFGDNISVLLIDIDLFKNVNDTYGHEAGDVVLSIVAMSIKSCVKPSDIIIRWGGEEFVVILPKCMINDAYSIAENIRYVIEKTDNSICRVTVSIGVARYEEDYQKTIAFADKALYIAKKIGRNQVVSYDDVRESKMRIVR